jgi:ATP-dependent Clp protease ATP-binding subunit ClpC
VVKVGKRLKERSISLSISTSARAQLANEGFDRNFGARPLRRIIQRDVEDELSEAFLRGDVREGDAVEFDYVDGKMSLHVPNRPDRGGQGEPQRELPALLG